MDYKIFWTNEAINNLEEILDYLIKYWSQKEVDNFKKSLSKQIHLIQRLSKQTTLFYEVNDHIIYLVFLFVNYQDVEKIKKF
jgi:plasmid stabilization system protein ParE